MESTRLRSAFFFISIFLLLADFGDSAPTESNESNESLISLLIFFIGKIVNILINIVNPPTVEHTSEAVPSTTPNNESSEEYDYGYIYHNDSGLMYL